MTLSGVGIGWRDELAGFVKRRQDLGFLEVVAESLHAGRPLPDGLEELRRRGVPVVPHGVRLSLGSADEPDPARVGHLAALAEQLGSPLVSEHVAALLEWPAPELDEATFLTELLDRTGALLLLDLANLHANDRNQGGDPLTFLDALPLERIAYVHVAGGVERDGLYHDTHAHPTPPAVLELVAELCARRDPPGSCWSATTPTRPRPSWPRSWTPSPSPPAPGRPAGERPGPGAPGPAGRRAGRDFGGRFLAFAARRPPPRRGGALADGLGFARALARAGRLPANARAEAMVAAAHLSTRPARLAAGLAGPPRRLVVTVRAPGLGEHWLSVPLGQGPR